MRKSRIVLGLACAIAAAGALKVTASSNDAVNKALPESFLGMLRKEVPRFPIAGPTTDMLYDDGSKLIDQAERKLKA